MEDIPYGRLAIHGENPLHWAAKNGNIELIRKLIEENYSPNTCNFGATSPLYYAAMNNHLEACKTLLEYGADPRDRSGFSGWYPDEVTDDIHVKEFLTKVRNRLEKAIDENLALQTVYRIRRWGEDCISHTTQKDTVAKKLWPQPYDLREDFDGDIEKMAQKLQGEWKIFKQLLNEFDQGTFKNNKICAFCCSIEGKKLRCGKCKEVYFCNIECQKKAHLCHKTLCKKKVE